MTSGCQVDSWVRKSKVQKTGLATDTLSGVIGKWMVTEDTGVCEIREETEKPDMKAYELSP